MITDFADLPAIFCSNDHRLIDQLAAEARQITRQYFGRTVVLYAPLYIANYCENTCVYCGFSAARKIVRKKLSRAELAAECQVLAEKGIQNVLILTGESRTHSPITYIKEAVIMAKEYFSNIALEVYPMAVDEYRELYLAGADGVTIYQETYDRDVYRQLHLSGKKTDYEYRYQAPERVARSGLRHLSLGVLLGLADWPQDVQALFQHLRTLEKKYPGVEYSLSFPRIRKVPGDQNNYREITDLDMLKIVSAARLLFPRVGINLSTRESAAFRDFLLEFGVTKMSAGSSTLVGGYDQTAEGSSDFQFAVCDNRSVTEIKAALEKKGYDPVVTDWRSIANE